MRGWSGGRQRRGNRRQAALRQAASATHPRVRAHHGGGNAAAAARKPLRGERFSGSAVMLRRRHASGPRCHRLQRAFSTLWSWSRWLGMLRDGHVWRGSSHFFTRDFSRLSPSSDRWNRGIAVLLRCAVKHRRDGPVIEHLVDCARQQRSNREHRESGEPLRFGDRERVSNHDLVDELGLQYLRRGV